MANELTDSRLKPESACRQSGARQPGRIGSRRGLGLLPFCKRTLKIQKPLESRKLTLFKPYPAQLKTLADHLRKRRIDRLLTLHQAAQIFGVKWETYAHWESGIFVPGVARRAAIVDFLKYDPFVDRSSAIR